MRRLHGEFGDPVGFVLVNTREAQPGDVFGQPQMWQEKWAHATERRDRHGLTFEVVVGGIAGTRRCALILKPNSVYLLDPSGIVPALRDQLSAAISTWYHGRYVLCLTRTARV